MDAFQYKGFNLSGLLKTQNLYFLPLVFAGLLFLSSCSTTKRLNDNKFLLIKNEIKVVNPHKEFHSSDLESLIQQNPNKKFAGVFPFKLWVNSMFPNSGEKPVALDISLIEESKEQMNKYLNNSGFYNSKIEHTIRYKKRKAKKVTYLVTLAEPYVINELSFNIPDKKVFSTVKSYRSETLIVQGQIFNSFILDKERSRLAKTLNDNGYFEFTKDYIFFEADSTLNNKKVNLTLNVRQYNPMGSSSETKQDETDHKVYYIHNIFIHPDFIPFTTDTILFDTLVEKPQRKNQPYPYHFQYVFKNPLKIKPQVLTRSLFIGNDQKYNATDAYQSYKKLNELRIFKYVDIKFRKSSFHSANNPKRNYLDCNINLTRNPVHSYSIEAQGTNSGGDLGLAGYLVYQNKNIFRGGEVINIRVKGAMEAQESGLEEESTQNNFLFFNTFEAGVEASLYIPKFLAPVNEELFSRYFRPKTTLNLGYNWQDRIEYNRIITNISFGYEWSETRKKNHILYPIDINLVKVNTTPDFDSILANESQRYQNQYTDHLILGLRYSYIFNNQELNKIKDFMYFRGNIESSGNLLDLAVKSFKQEENAEGFNTIFGIRYSQYVKTNFDFRYYIMIDKRNSIVLRSFTGIAIPYGNSVDIPFEKGYYGGGANGMRAWPLRYLGPGAYQPGAKKIERVGDIIIEANIEYRFPIYNIFTGALFYDVGNIWLINENETFPGGKFNIDSFLSELAMDVGIGIRLDFNYFIFRIDFAQRLKDPSKDKYDRWVPGSTPDWFNTIVNLGIGYPF